MAQNTVVFQLREDTQQIFVDASSLDSQLGTIVFWQVGLRITSPDSQTVFESANFEADNFTALLANNGNKTALLSMPVDVASKGISGNWTFEIAIRHTTVSPVVITRFENVVAVVFPDPEVTIQQAVDINASSLVSTDITSYGATGLAAPVITRAHKVTYPLQVNLPPVTNALQNLTITGIYEGLFRSDITATLVYTMVGFSGRYTTRIVRSGFKTVQVVYYTLEEIQQKLFDLNSRYEASVSRGNPSQSITFQKLTRCTQLLALFEQATRAGRQDLVANYYNALVAILGADDVAVTVYG